MEKNTRFGSHDSGLQAFHQELGGPGTPPFHRQRPQDRGPGAAGREPCDANRVKRRASDPRSMGARLRRAIFGLPSFRRLPLTGSKTATLTGPGG